MTAPTSEPKLQESRSSGTPEDRLAFDAILKQHADEGAPSGIQDGEATAEETEESGKSSKYEKALARLKFLKIDDAVLKRMSQTDAIELATAVSAREKKHNELLTENARLKSQIGKAQATSKTEPPPTVELDLKAFKAELTEDLGERSGGRLAELFDGLHKVVAHRDSRMEALESHLAAIQERDLKRAEREAIRALGERFPELTDQDMLNEVRQEMAVLVAAPRFQAMLSDPDEFVPALLEAAARSRGLREVGVDEREQSKARSIARRAGSAETGEARGNKSGAGKSADRRAFDHIMAHPGDVRGAIKLASS